MLSWRWTICWPALTDAIGGTLSQRPHNIAVHWPDEPASAPMLRIVESAAALNSSPQ